MKPVVEGSNSFDQWRQKTNQISSNIGDPSLLNTAVKTDVVSAVNSLLSGGLQFIYEQQVPSNVWTINHNMNKYPSITTLDAFGRIVEGDPQYFNRNTVVITFSISISGTAFLT